MSKTIKLKRGFDINLAGKAEKKIANVPLSKTFAIKPTDFAGMERPKVLVQEGDTVEAGTPVLFDKKMDGIMYTSPVSGEVAEVRRGEKRKLLEVIILADEEVKYKQFPHGKMSVSDIKNLSSDDARSIMMESGVWPNILQRPFAIVADPAEEPKSIFISAFDSSPLGPDYDFLFKDQEKYFQAGVDVLQKFTSGAIHVNIDGSAEVSNLYAHTKGIEINKFSGKYRHPLGNVGVQIHHIDPIRKGDIVWAINPFGVIQIGKLFLEGRYDASKLVAVAGAEVQKPQYYKTYSGACVSKLLEKNLNHQENIRVISGNVLSGEKISKDGYLGFYDHLVTVIPEGNKPRFFLTEGWLAPTKRLSFHRAFGLLSFLKGKNDYVLDTSVNGEERAFVMTGAFEEVTPMDILPMHLVKAIMAEDFDDMEALGIYEVAPEDLALCEFIDVSKHDIQDIIRQGIKMIREA